MKRAFFVGMAAILAMVLSGCGGGDSHPVSVARILSNQPADGDIAFDPVPQTFAITNGPDTVFFGIDNLDPDLPEYRAFLDFPLDGSTGGDVVPAAAGIVSATLELYLTEVSIGTVPVLLDLVSYPISGLREQDFSTAPLEFRSLDLFASDQGNFVDIDVTPLMREAQRLGLVDFQVRLLLDFDQADSGFVGIDDRPAVTATAPLLVVEYD